MSDPQKPWLHGRKPGDRRVRVERPHSAFFRYSGPGTLVAREAASAPRTASGRIVERIRHVLFGRRLSIHEEANERLSKKKALAIFSSDPISSSAYATEEILRVLVLAGAAVLFVSLPIAIAVAVLLDSRVAELPADRPCLSVGRRRLCRCAAELAAHGVARRRRRAAPRLRHDGGSFDRIGVRAGHLGGARPGGLPGRHRGRGDRPHHPRQYAWPVRVGEHLRDPDLSFRGLGPADDRRSAYSASSSTARALRLPVHFPARRAYPRCSACSC